jgi:hypothetical protein
MSVRIFTTSNIAVGNFLIEYLDSMQEFQRIYRPAMYVIRKDAQ